MMEVEEDQQGVLEESETQIVETETVIQDDGEIMESIIIDDNIHLVHHHSGGGEGGDELEQQHYHQEMQHEDDTEKLVQDQHNSQEEEEEEQQQTQELQQQQQDEQEQHERELQQSVQDKIQNSHQQYEMTVEDVDGDGVEHVSIMEVHEIGNQMTEEEERNDPGTQSANNNEDEDSGQNINSGSTCGDDNTRDDSQIIENETQHDSEQVNDDEDSHQDTSHENAITLHEDSCVDDERIIGSGGEEEEGEGEGEEDEGEGAVGDRDEDEGDEHQEELSVSDEEDGDNSVWNENRCIVCNLAMNVDDPANKTEGNEKLKKFFFEYLAVSEKLELESDTTFPFCEPCTEDLDRLMGLACKIEFMDLQFEKLRDTMARKTVRTYIHRTRPEALRDSPEPPMFEDINDEPIETNSLPQRQYSLTDLVFRQWKRQYDTIIPGRYKKYPTFLKAIDAKQKVSYYRVDQSGKHHYIASAHSDETEQQQQMHQQQQQQQPITILASPISTSNMQQQQIRQGIKRQMSTPVFKINGDTFKRIRTYEQNAEGEVLNGDVMEQEWNVEDQEVETEEDRKHPYKCGLCPKAFNSKSLLNYHTRIHSGELPFECDICGKGFAVPHYLMIHMRSHTGERPFKCNICEKTFAQRGGLATHALVHSGEKPYTCNECGKSFRQKYHLTQHQLIHSGLKPFSCDICNKSFNVKMNLREHMRRHTGERPYRCSYCTCQGFFRKKMLRDHIVKSHPERQLPEELVELGPTPKFPKTKNQVQQIQLHQLPQKGQLQQRQQIVYQNVQIKTEALDNSDPLYNNTIQQHQQQQRVISRTIRTGAGSSATLVSIDVVEDKIPQLDSILEDSDDHMGSSSQDSNHHHSNNTSTEKNPPNLDLINVEQQDSDSIRLQLVDTMTIHGPPEPILTDGQQITSDS